MTTKRPPGIDPRIPRFSQAITGTLLLVAFLVAPEWTPALWAVPVLGVFLGAGALLGPRFNVWGLIFRHAVIPLLRLGPPAKRKDGAPPRFAMLLGTVFLAAATILLFATTGAAHLVGWILVLAVAALALLAAITEVCVGCEIYNLALRMKTRGSTPATQADDQDRSDRD